MTTHFRAKASVSLMVAGGASLALLVHCSSSDSNNPGNPSTDAGGGTDSSCVGAACTDAAASDDGGGGADTSTGDDGSVDSGFDAGPACDPDASTPCTGSLSCCSGHCVDTTQSNDNCGSCGNACTALQFCMGATGCSASTFRHVCASTTATLVHDSKPLDDSAGDVLGAGLGACTPAVTVSTKSQADPGVLATDSRPITGVGNPFVAAGGPFFQQGIGYMDQAISPVTFVSTNGGNGSSYVQRSNSVTIASDTNANLTATHDYFLLEMMTEPVSGTLVVSAQGFQAPGTAAAAWWFQNKIVPAINADGGADPSIIDSRWYVYEWTDNAGGGTASAPDATDTFTLKGSGI